MGEASELCLKLQLTAISWAASLVSCVGSVGEALVVVATSYSTAVLLCTEVVSKRLCGPAVCVHGRQKTACRGFGGSYCSLCTRLEAAARREHAQSVGDLLPVCTGAKKAVQRTDSRQQTADTPHSVLCACSLLPPIYTETRLWEKYTLSLSTLQRFSK